MFKKVLITASLLISSCLLYAKSAPPSPYGPVPSKHQLDWHKQEYYGLVCFGLNTYTGQEWGYGNQPTSLFNPSNLDTDQWARVSKKAGLKGLILVAKHHDGFCLWPSKTTKYTVAASPWKDGKGDVLRDLSDSCKKYGLKLGVYISPWDRNHAEYGREQYVKDYHEQWREVLTGYGDIFEVWFDGANGGSGYYGGANESRSISKDYYRYDEVFNLIKSKQPQAVFFGGVGEDAVRWVGNESGYANKTNWCALHTAKTGNVQILMRGQKDGKVWVPAEADTTILQPKKWYYNPSSAPRNLTDFTNLFYTSIGRNASLNLGLSIGPDGLIPDRDVKAMLAAKKHLDKVFKKELAVKSSASASDVRGKEFSAQNVLKASDQKYWATKDGVQEASLTLSFDKSVTFNRVLLQEYIALGQRIHKFTVEVENEGVWRQVASETTIGYKRILRIETATGQKVRFNFT
ncbi:MAG: alpha-L-fucosidase, partial [Lentisphaeria bacterium]|nr:alpha-L-fucosidase [Lentisphaeria bacterium]